MHIAQRRAPPTSSGYSRQARLRRSSRGTTLGAAAARVAPR